MTNSHGPFPAHFFRRNDESDDAVFYQPPRFVTHIDRATINALTDFYREAIPSGARVLDLMSSWVSHLPADVECERVAGLGMNEAELADNPRLDDHAVHNLNRTPELPYGDGEFDAVLNAVSIQYLTRPLDVFASVQRVLRPGGIHAVAVSHVPAEGGGGVAVAEPRRPYRPRRLVLRADARVGRADRRRPLTAGLRPAVDRRRADRRGGGSVRA